MKTSHLLFIAVLGAMLRYGVFPTHHDVSQRPLKKRTVKVLSYNIHHASPPAKPGTIDLQAIADVIIEQQPDLVALQEVDVFTKRSGPFHQAEELARKAGMTAHFFKTIDYDGGEYGIAILSRLPVLETQRYPLPRKEGSGGEPRVLGTATVQLSSKYQLLFACTHLDAQRDSANRHLQIRAIEGLLKDSALPVIIAGDFNAAPGSGVINILDNTFKRTCDPCDFTIPVDQPETAIDFIAYAPRTLFTVKEHTVLPGRQASDHLPVSVTLQANLKGL